MKLINYSLVDINKEDNTTFTYGGLRLHAIKEGSEYQKTTQKGIMHHPQEGIGISKGEKVWFFHKAVDNKTTYFGDLKYAITSDDILGIQRGENIEPTTRIIAKSLKRKAKTVGLIVIESKDVLVDDLFEVESAPKDSGYSKGDYIIPRKNSAYYIKECDRYFIKTDRVIATAKVELKDELVENTEIVELKNGHHVVSKLAVEGEYEKVGSIFLQKTHLYQPEWCTVIKSDKFNVGDTVFCVKSMGGSIKINDQELIAVNNEQIFFSK